MTGPPDPGDERWSSARAEFNEGNAEAIVEINRARERGEWPFGVLGAPVLPASGGSGEEKCSNPRCVDGWVPWEPNESGGAPPIPCRVCRRAFGRGLGEAPSDTARGVANELWEFAHYCDSVAPECVGAKRRIWLDRAKWARGLADRLHSGEAPAGLTKRLAKLFDDDGAISSGKHAGEYPGDVLRAALRGQGED